VGGYELQPVLQTGNGSSTTAIRPNAVNAVGTAQDAAAADGQIQLTVGVVSLVDPPPHLLETNRCSNAVARPPCQPGRRGGFKAHPRRPLTFGYGPKEA
jgi:hypothetical protein